MYVCISYENARVCTYIRMYVCISYVYPHLLLSLKICLFVVCLGELNDAISSFLIIKQKKKRKNFFFSHCFVMRKDDMGKMHFSDKVEIYI